ncbi:hypothetical protein SAMN06295905_2904 [Devosia lucknowensis]|uniref:Uncharacterized protein n=1 Tax=Devosia lucknowensis TaxID=1096929 RepID=A0A1Y6GB14_9HYPH|nr:hypothetical protein [Devosia lucknowensis]SMQ85617.1 hypothetical protein SAMN06295905_2904 [Devosia lucknowensis]
MPTHTDHPASFGQPPQDQPAPQAAPHPRLSEGTTTKSQAERHEALWLSLAALQKDTIALGAKKPNAPVSEALRISAEGLLSDCAAFTRKRNERLPVAAPDLAGLAAQLGQALAALEGWEARHTTWATRFNCRIWTLHSGYRPIMRLHPPAAALNFKRDDTDVIRDKLSRMIRSGERAAYEAGFSAGRAARQGEPPAPSAPEAMAAPTQTYPRLRRLD